MTWIKFAIWLGGLYFIYYLLIILWDNIRQKPGGPLSQTDELTFSDHAPPKVIAPQYEDNDTDGAIISSGGVNLKALFNLAREESIEYIRPVSF